MASKQSPAKITLGMMKGNKRIINIITYSNNYVLLKYFILFMLIYFCLIR